MPELVSRSQRFYRVMNDLRIRSEQGLIIPMHFSESQEIIWKVVAPFLDNHKRMRFIVLKSRQVYSSTFFEALLFTRTIEQPGTQSLVLAQDLASSHALFNMAKRFYEHLPMPKFAPPKQNEIFLPFKTAPSVFKVVSAGVSAKGRGTTQTCVHASETAFWQHPEILTGLFQTMPDVDDTLWVIESTANGKQGDGRMFYEEWSRAISGDSDTTPIFVPWFAMQKYRGSRLSRDPIPENEWDSEEKVLARTFGIDGDQIAWKRYATQAKCQGQIEMFHQEYPATPEEAFIASGMPAFDRLALMEQSLNVCPPLARGRMDFNQLTKKGAFKEDTSGEVRIWKFPIAGHQYVIGADTSEGLEREGPEDKQSPDASCAEVLDMSTLEQVASVHGQIAPWEFSCTLAAMGLWYNKAIVAIEVNNTGHAVQDHMIRTHLYPMLHPWRGKPDRVNRGRAKLYGWECLDPNAKVLTSDLRWVPAQDVRVGDKLFGCDESALPGKANVRHLKTQEVIGLEEFFAEKVKVTLINGAQTQVSTNHPILAQRHGSFRWIEAIDLRPGDRVKYLPPWEELRSYDAGRLSAFLDGEGHLCQGKPNGLQMLVSQAEGPLAEEIVQLWASLGFDATFKWVRHKKRPIEKPVATCGVIRLPEVLRALGSLRPTRLLRSFFEKVILEKLTIKSFNTVAVQRVEAVEDGLVIGLTTDPSHTLIADGIVGHNTNVYSRPLMIEAGRRCINKVLVTIHEAKLIDELNDFSRSDSGKYEAEAGHDDRVMAFLLALRSREENYYPAKVKLEVSDEITIPGVHVVEVLDDKATTRKHIGKVLRDAADKAAKGWMEL